MNFASIACVKRDLFLCVIFFTKDSDPATLMEATAYLLDNEHMRHIVFVTCLPQGIEEPRPVVYDILRLEFPELAQIDYVTAEEEFTPEFTKRIAKEYQIPKQRMYMAAFSDKFPFSYSELGGIRLIAAQAPGTFQPYPTMVGLVDSHTVHGATISIKSDDISEAASPEKSPSSPEPLLRDGHDGHSNGDSNGHSKEPNQAPAKSEKNVLTT